jgi:hypothetical protein
MHVPGMQDMFLRRRAMRLPTVVVHFQKVRKKTPYLLMQFDIMS